MWWIIFKNIVHFIVTFSANNGQPFRFRIGSVKSAQLFQLSAENFFRLRYESVPLQWHVNWSNFRNPRWHNLFQKWNWIESKSDEINASESDPNWAVVVPMWHYFFRISAELCRRSLCQRSTICSEFRQNCADLFGFSAELCRIWDYYMPRCAVVDTICSEFRQNCADFETILCWIVPILRLFFSRIGPSLCLILLDYFFAQIKLYQLCADLCFLGLLYS